MAVFYNQQIFEEFLAKAIQSPEEFVVGETYYSNTFPEKFIFLGLLTNKESYRHEGLPWTDEETANDIGWYVYQEHTHQARRIGSLMDRNIGAHYNPWLIFANEEDSKACRAELTPHYSRNF